MVLPRIGIARRVVGVCVTVVFVARFGCLAVALLAIGSGSCLLYTDHINRPPEVKLTGDTTATWGLARPRYHAEAHDPDQTAASLTYEWRRQLGACPMTPEAAATGPIVGESKPDYENDVDFPEAFCVWVVVRDNDKASDFATLKTEVKHQQTVAVIDVIQPKETQGDRYPLFSALRLSAARSMDPEKGKLMFRWLVTRNGGPLNTTPCTEAPDTDICFPADQPGEIMVTLTVKNARDVETMQGRKLTIEPDAPPCIRRTDPELLSRLVRDANDPDLTFEVQSVDDDGDPFPAVAGRTSTLSFIATWWREGEDSNNPSGRRPAILAQLPSVTFGSNYFRNGDRAFVRIQVNDRVTRDFSACARDKVDNCALRKEEDPTCFQWVTWKVDFLLGGEKM